MKNKGFFSPSRSFQSTTSVSKITQCGSCRLNKTCGKFSKIKPSGNFKKKILLVLESPGNNDSQEMKLFGKQGSLLRRSFRKIGINIKEDCLVTSAVLCEPSGKIGINHASFCFPSLLKLIKEKEPNVIITFGSMASLNLLSMGWKEKPGSFERWTGQTIPFQNLNTWVCPTYNPMDILVKQHQVMESLFAKHVKNAVEKAKEKPWKEIPDYKKNIFLELCPKETAYRIASGIKTHEKAAFDYETNKLKPDGKNAKIVSCSICFGGLYTIAFPWHGEAIEATSKFLNSSIKKYASNMKFEDRWTRAILGFPVRNFVWDTMIAAHLLNNRKGVTGLKFLSFVNFGMPDYDSHVKPFLKSSNEDGTNRIDEIDMKDLLFYNGLDSLLTYEVVRKQMKEMEKLQ